MRPKGRQYRTSQSGGVHAAVRQADRDERSDLLPNSLGTAAAGSRHPWFLTGVFLTCMCGLMLQIMETRVLSVLVYYHLAFFAIGVAMLGMTAGALFVFYRFDTAYTPAPLFDAMARVMSLFAWSVLASLVGLLSLALGAKFEPTLTFVLSWTLAVVILLPPYVLLGITVSLALTRSSQRISLVYGVDLVGAAAGCLVTLVLLSVIDTYSAVLLVGAVGATAALAFRKAARSAAPASAGRAQSACPQARSGCRPSG